MKASPKAFFGLGLFGLWPLGLFFHKEKKMPVAEAQLVLVEVAGQDDGIVGTNSGTCLHYGNASALSVMDESLGQKKHRQFFDFFFDAATNFFTVSAACSQGKFWGYIDS